MRRAKVSRAHRVRKVSPAGSVGASASPSCPLDNRTLSWTRFQGAELINQLIKPLPVSFFGQHVVRDDNQLRDVVFCFLYQGAVLPKKPFRIVGKPAGRIQAPQVTARYIQSGNNLYALDQLKGPAICQLRRTV